jgi:type IV pilus assembly protein PilC
MEFHCRVATASGEVTEGVYIAESESRLRRELEDRGMFVLDARRKGALGWPILSLPQRRRVPGREFLVFNQELATLLKAGMPLVQSLDILRQRITHPVFRSVLDDVHDRVRAGTSLSEAFEAQDGLFPGVYTASLFAGEKSGGLEQVLRRYVSYVKVIGAVRRRTLSALVYPAVLTVLSVAVVVLIILRVVPAFADFYGGFGAELPAATRGIMALSAVAREYFALLLVGLVGGAGAGWYWVKQPGRRSHVDRWLVKLPGLGPITRKFATSQLARTLATLLGGGIPLVNALEISARSMGNRFLAGELEVVSQRVREGQGLAPALADRGVFPDVAIKMVEVGESTGALQDMLNSLADFYDEEIETHLGRFVTLIEPVLLVVMGLIIAALLLALYMPLFQLSTVLS